MKKIKKLSKEVIDYIRAGQVVDRPSSIVKELMENALDAQAHTVLVKLFSGGKEKIIVTDDGCGMDEDDLLMSIQPHSTSKILNVADLNELYTFGFRGEALASIASVAELKIESRTMESDRGMYVMVHSGDTSDMGPIGMPVGTQVIVSQLFSHVPVRKKLLKSETTEYSACLTEFIKCALAHIDVAFELQHNGKVVLHLHSGDTLQQRIIDIYGSSVAGSLLPFSITADHFVAMGFFGKPQIGTTSQVRQQVFVNGRAVEMKSIAHKIKDVYSSLLEPRSHPAFFIFITLTPSLVDPNVDPKKKKVVLHIQSEVEYELSIMCQKVLDAADLTYVHSDKANGFYDAYKMDRTLATALKRNIDGWNVKDVTIDDSSQILQIGALYLVGQTETGILIIDQHAAHEKILYEQYLKEFFRHRKKKSILKAPIVFELPLVECGAFNKLLPDLSEIGFTINQLAGSQSKFEITTAPVIFINRNLPELLTEILHDFITLGKSKDIDVATHRTLSYIACRTAIKAGEVLTQAERKRLFKKLLETDNLYTCPHGRPVKVEIDLHTLHRMFKRVK